ncbi:hypothetical protein [Nocardia asteroides]|uniref:hypothetical protein n=1 Tax=Nocardia asteroides TaxID=1824 RepID=UPI001E648EC0|nr:hypothetical protein [Nocardia asteroides]UGT55179.1 hypothetical protein LTT85_32135 [Nocardia asteroides]
MGTFNCRTEPTVEIYGDVMHQPLDTGVLALLNATMVGLADERPVDGACLTTAPQVTQALTLQGLSARTIRVAGWLDEARTILAFLHLATHCHGMVLDGTARQFNPELPHAWVTTEQDYLRDLATAARTEHATILE